MKQTKPPQPGAAQPTRNSGVNGTDLLGLAGAAALVGGAAWVYPPAGLIVAGALALALALLAARRAESGRDGA